jgi:hypothetical protein
MTYIKFGWYDLTKPQKFEVLPQYAAVDSIEFKKTDEIKAGTLVDQIRRS